MRSRRRFDRPWARVLAAGLPWLAVAGRAASSGSAGDLVAAGALERMERDRGVASPVSLADLRARVLSTDQVLLEYSVSGTDVLVVLVSQDRCRVARVSADADSLRRLADGLRADLDRTAPDLDAARTLHRILVDPVAGDLPPEARLVVVADGPIGDVPFAALHDGVTFLCERHPISRAVSASALAAPMPTARRYQRRAPPALVMSTGPRPARTSLADTAVVENAPEPLQAEVRRRVLEERLPPDVALQRAQRQAIRAGRSPRDWAMATAWGRMRAVRADGRFPAWIVPVGLATGLAMLALAWRLTSGVARADETA
jgi:hypothetical protein